MPSSITPISLPPARGCGCATSAVSRNGYLPSGKRVVDSPVSILPQETSSPPASINIGYQPLMRIHRPEYPVPFTSLFFFVLCG
ncbi:hypothetical protein NXU97_19205 [Bacteroides xylanisolvens]|uniref:hypothetical protein n=1 Tax=Bacteroides TaxID=816 RepID=UPI001E2CEC02|nr:MULTISPECIES: hypothetical protein [Bacteroides]MCS2675814.1 hypothetical protein [Bacteroides ovatus]MCS3335618.1 hypothetical protein [Bacteroides xylanisolvens]WET84791.1 hypothetical protein P2T61_19230 [Bacteroides xylanisolvens]